MVGKSLKTMKSEKRIQMEVSGNMMKGSSLGSSEMRSGWRSMREVLEF